MSQLTQAQAPGGAANPQQAIQVPVTPGVIPPLPKWLSDLLRHLHSLGSDANTPGTMPRYEASLYGAINSLLTVFFPAHLTFVVKPQPRLRKRAASAVAPNGARRSVDSYEEYVETRSKDPIPDFIVCKAGNDFASDVYFLIVEVKRSKESISEHSPQFEDYIEWANEHISSASQARLPQQYVMVIVGHEVTLFTIDVTGSTVVHDQFDLWSLRTLQIFHTLRAIHGRTAIQGSVPTR